MIVNAHNLYSCTHEYRFENKHYHHHHQQQQQRQQQRQRQKETDTNEICQNALNSLYARVISSISMGTSISSEKSLLYFDLDQFQPVH